MSCSGTNAYHYGTMKENVISLTCVLASGAVIKTHNRPRKSSAGYDLTHLVIGSEGTLALVTEAVLRLAPLPRNLHVGLATFASFQQGVDVVVALQKLGHRLEALELADGPQMRCVNVSGLAPRRAFSEVPTLFFKIAGPDVHSVAAQVSTMQQLCQAHGASTVEIHDKKDDMDVIWGARKCMGTALLAMKKDETDLFLHSDCAVPISNLERLVAGTQKLIARASAANQADWFCANVGHIGDGNVHSSIVCPRQHYDAAMHVLGEVARLALQLDGTVTGEHGVGMKLRDALVEEVGMEGVEMMRGIKRALDPRGILNPDKVCRLEGGGSMAKL
jgi:D-lactate dehydrogenase (cytochrome)